MSYDADVAKPFGSTAFNKRPPLSNSNRDTAPVTVSVITVMSRSTVDEYTNETGEPAADDCNVTRPNPSKVFDINATPVGSANCCKRPDPSGVIA